jgi:hypothetical protein
MFLIDLSLSVYIEANIRAFRTLTEHLSLQGKYLTPLHVIWKMKRRFLESSWLASLELLLILITKCPSSCSLNIFLTVPVQSEYEIVSSGNMRHYPTCQTVAGSIPDEVTGFSNWPNPSSRTMALRSAEPITEMSTRNLYWDKGRPARKVTTSPPSVGRLSRNVGTSTSHNRMGLHVP